MPPALSRHLPLVLAFTLALSPPPVAAQSEPAVLTVRTTGDSRLNLRAAASATAAVLLQLGAGTEVQNLGCMSEGGRRWCRIATLVQPRIEGWAAAEFLADAASPALGGGLSPAETACLAAVSRQTNTADVAILALDDDRPEVLVQVGVGPARAPWQCLAAPDGSTRGIEYLGTGGDADPAASPPTAEAACRAAVAQAAGNGMVLAMSASPAAAGTLVRLVVGTDPAPWTCVALPDGRTTELRRQGG